MPSEGVLLMSSEQITLELKNVSTVMRQCQAYPPKSSYFSVGLGNNPFVLFDGLSVADV